MGRKAYSPVETAIAPPAHLDDEGHGSSAVADGPARRRTWRDRYRGWRAVMCRGVLATLLGMLLNIGLLVWSVIIFDPNGYNSVVWTGNCKVASNANSIGHVVVNILATLLVSAASNTINYLTAPSRQDLDRLHARGDSVQVGVWDLRNWKVMSWLRKLLFACALLSSIPLHIFYNSIFTITYVADDWTGFVVPPSFVEGAQWNSSYLDSAWPEVVPYLAEIQHNATSGSMQRLDTAACERLLKQSLVLNASTILFVTADSDDPEVSSAEFPSLFVQHDSVGNKDAWGAASGSNHDPLINLTTINHYDWTKLWNRTSSVSELYPNVASNLSAVEYCLAQWQPEQCTIHLIPRLIVPVVIFNFLGVLAACVLFFRRSFEPLATLGDAISSFMTRACPHSLPQTLSNIRYGRVRGSSPGGNATLAMNPLERLLGRVSIHRAKHFPKIYTKQDDDQRWFPSRVRWHSAVSSARWFWTTLFFILYWFAGLIYFAVVMVQSTSAKFSISQGFDGPTPTSDTSPALVYNYNSFLSNIVLANVFQVILAANYLFYQNILARMALAAEFSTYVSQHKMLRVSNPTGKQRAGYFFAVPYRLAIALLIVSTTLHFLVSEAIFYEQLKPRITVPLQSTLALQFHTAFVHAVVCNPEALLVFEAVGLLAPAAAFGFGWLRRFHTGAPMVAGDSRVIASLSACRPAVRGEVEVLRPLQWGVLNETQEGGTVGFSSGMVQPLQAGKVYEMRE